MNERLTHEIVAKSDATLSNPQQIKAPAAMAAHRHLLDSAEHMQLRAESHNSAISAIKLYDRNDRYLFSWIINAHHLLFYIRKPAIKILPSIRIRAQNELIGAKVNRAGEITIRLETIAEAARLTQWLYDPATWSPFSAEADALEALPSLGLRNLPSQ